MCDHSTDFCQLRHRWEMPLIWVSGLVSFFAFVLGMVVLSLDDSTMTSLFGEEAENAADLASNALIFVTVPIGVYFYRFYLAAQAKSNAIRVGPAQMPKIWAVYEDLGRRLEMPRLPRLYVTNGNGVVNAYALSCNKRNNYIVLHAEVALAIDTRPEIVEFVLAHEMAHHKLGHVALWRIAIGLIPNILVPLGISTSRAQEYSADRVALKVCGHHVQAMKLLAIGPWMVDQVNPDAWDTQCETDRRELYVRAANVMSGHAVMSKRYKALRDIETQGYGTHGDMF